MERCMQCGEPDGHARGCPASVASPSSAATLSELVAESKRCVERLNQIEADLKRLHGRELGDGNRDVQQANATIEEVYQDGLRIVMSRDSSFARLSQLWLLVVDARERARKTGESQDKTSTKAG